MSLHIVVIGAGIVGASTALELQRDGHRVTLVEPGQPGGPQAASFGNGAWLSPASVVPMSMPGLWKKVPGYLMDPLGPLTIRWTALPALAPWLLRFIAAGATVPKVEATARALKALLADAPERHMALAGETGLSDLVERKGLLYAYPDRAAFEAEALAWRLRRDNGIVWRELDGQALKALEPTLHPRYSFGALVEAGAHCVDPGAYVAGLVAFAESRGLTRIEAAATGFDIVGGRLQVVRTAKGSVPCDRAVIAAGVHSKALAAEAGDKVSLASERGYHVVVAAPESGPHLPVMPSDGKMANTPTRAGLRASGQVELAAVTAAPNWKRADVLLDHLLNTYPGLPRQVPEARLSRWLGHRPSTPDGVPVIGQASACTDIVHAFGHGHVGLASGPITGRLVADIIAGRPPERDIRPYAAARFRR
ncbi:glycine/D-amino acid oxidase-like deaminating enzyme [Azorhizobium sp. AG788]|uniref:NAD(P)/FAD-dependent oxidoreductase n=1 Tax=Azorhizobium sp. AG788 TaxID=2183897 RepID=UPI0010616FDA|nr:FAD-binding oxidoreductase [Azorhizobium sp. AG788]TDT87735.1 glycine/D-amino acid oxidase-like deaminating enzyme [Azorhizobium sp. AG788]